MTKLLFLPQCCSPALCFETYLYSLKLEYSAALDHEFPTRVILPPRGQKSVLRVNTFFFYSFYVYSTEWSHTEHKQICSISMVFRFHGGWCEQENLKRSKKSLGNDKEDDSKTHWAERRGDWWPHPPLLFSQMYLEVRLHASGVSKDT